FVFSPKPQNQSLFLAAMVVYSCHCLNIQVFGEKPEKTSTDCLKNCPLSPSCELIELLDQGFQFRHKCLVQRMKDGDWTVYVCVPCHLRTHAVNHEARIVVVSLLMEKNEDVIKAMKKRHDYSPVFNLLLSSPEGRPRDEGLIQSQNYETLQKQLGELQLILSKYLKAEEEAMERRIRAYEEEQRNQFAKIKEIAQNDKTKLISVLFHNSEGSQNNSNIDNKGHIPLSHSKSAVESGGKELGSKPGGNKGRRRRDSSPDVFAMDELEFDEEEELVRSENDQNSSNSESFGRNRSSHLDSSDENNSENDKAPRMSTSVPISMPMHARSVRTLSYLDDDIEETAEFADIPRNMQALSESIQERDRYIFGDRPRQRVHTGDFTQVNWH
ncbi:hypothetical protein BgiBS90_018036, partial [Biomphalaria glabrata]